MAKPAKAATKTATDLETQLKDGPLEVQQHVAALRAEVTRLSKNYARLEVQKLAVDAMNQELKGILEHQVDYGILTDGALQCIIDYYREHPNEPRHGTPFEQEGLPES